MRITVNAGHTPTGQGASRILNEVVENRPIRDAVKAALAARGHDVHDSTADEWMPYPQELNTQVARANASGAELAISIHLNAGGGTGTECLYYPGDENGRLYSERVAHQVSKLMGIPNRGAKPRSDLGWLNGTNMCAILPEICFVDSQADTEALRRTPYADIGAAIAAAVDGCDYSSGPVPSHDGGSRSVQLYPANQTDAQKWIRERMPDGNYRYTNVACGKALDVRGGSSEGTEYAERPVRVFPPNGTAAQSWREELVGEEGAPDSYVVLHSALDDRMVLDCVGGGKTEGTGLWLYPANRTTAQKFTFVWEGSPGVYYIHNLVSDLNLDVVGGGR